MKKEEKENSPIKKIPVQHNIVSSKDVKKDSHEKQRPAKKHHRHMAAKVKETAKQVQVHPSSHKPKMHKHHSTFKHASEMRMKMPKPQHYSKFQTDKDIAMDFATKVHRLFDHLIKATVLFGSQTTGEAKPGSDIDVIIIIDDAAINWDMELTAWYREELAKIISAQSYSKDLHINTIRLTTWWRDLLHGDPVVLNIVRQGQVLIDIGGFFSPIKALMMQGKIH